MKMRDPKTGRFVRTTPNYKAMYENMEKVFIKVCADLEIAEGQRDFLWRKSPFWVRNAYRKSCYNLDKR